VASSLKEQGNLINQVASTVSQQGSILENLGATVENQGNLINSLSSGQAQILELLRAQSSPASTPAPKVPSFIEPYKNGEGGDGNEGGEGTPLRAQGPGGSSGPPRP